MDSTIVIKVKYAETLRRFNARIVDGEFNLNMDGLREKTLGLFNFTPDTEFTMTYVDEDNDMVTLADDEDLRDVVRQGLNPLRITVNLSTESSSSRSSGTSTPLRSPQLQQASQSFNTEILNSIPEPLRSIVTKIATEILTSSGSSSAVFVQHFMEMCLNQHSNFQSGPKAAAQGGASGRAKIETVSQDTEGSKVKGIAADVLSSDGSEKAFRNAKSESTLKNDKFKCQSETGGSKGSVTTIPGLEDLRAAIDYVNELASVDPKPQSTSQSNVGKKKLIKLSSSSAPLVSRSELPVAEKTVKLSSLSAPSVSKSVPADKKEATEKPTTSSVPKSITVNALPFPCAPGPWSNLNSQPADASGGIRMGIGSRPGNSSTSNPVPSPMSDCPFTGMPLGNSSALPFMGMPLGNSSALPFTGMRLGNSSALPSQASFVLQNRRNQGQGDSLGMIFHRGVRCDGCGVHPITGPRFKSKVKDNYDLCTFCFGQMGNESDYIRMDRPMTYRHPFSFKGLHELPKRGHPAHPQVFRGCGMTKPIRSKLDSHFIQDMTILDGTLMAPLTPFTKIWRMRNNGTVVWPQGTQLVWIGGSKLSDAFAAELEIPDVGLHVDKELDVAVDFVAPKHPGRYVSYWRMASPSGQKFGQQVWVLIQVDASSKELSRESFHGFNLNWPPVPSGMSNPEIINVNPEPMVEDGLSELGLAGSNRTTELVEPIVDLPAQKEQEVNFPINDSLLVGGGISRPDPTAPSSSLVSYPILDLCAPAPAPASDPAPVTVVQTSPQDMGEKNEVEETLLTDLEEMGFKQVDLNKEILRLNEYDLEKSVDDLCGVSEWDPILEELHEMGFCDEERNKKLLKKNNESIKRVVMDLIAGEKM